MIMILGIPDPELAAAGAVTASVLVVSYLIIAPGPARLPWRRRRPDDGPEPTVIGRLADAMTGGVDLVLSRRGRTGAAGEILEEAGIHMRLQEFTALMIIATIVAGAAGTAIANILVGLVFAVAVPLLVRVWLGLRIGRRQHLFADQLEDSLQLLSSSLRAGHSMLQALNSVAREAESPTSEEFTRIINQTRVGRELGDALDETARRMQSDDFSWVTQAIAINRAVGGNLAEVLDAVGNTIRERGQIRRQVSALAAEGKMSAFVLMALPVGITAFLLITNPSYLAAFVTTGLLGYGMIGAAAVLMIIGTLWLRKTVSIKF